MPSKFRQVMKLFSSKLPIHSVRFFMYYKSYYFCVRSCKSHSQENEKFMSTTGQFSCTDSLPFKGRNLICTLDLIDLMMQIQPFLKGWTLKPDVSHHKQGKMFPFSSLVIKVWRAKPKYSHLVFLAFLASIKQITLARKWKVHEDKESIVTHR